jgi:hypothetical protein
MSVLEAGFKEDMTEAEAMALASKAIMSGIFNDAGSGSNVDLCIIRKDSTEMLRNYKYLADKTYRRQNPVVYPPGTASACPRQPFAGCKCFATPSGQCVMHTLACWVSNAARVASGGHCWQCCAQHKRCSCLEWLSHAQLLIGRLHGTHSMPWHQMLIGLHHSAAAIIQYTHTSENLCPMCIQLCVARTS